MIYRMLALLCVVSCASSTPVAESAATTATAPTLEAAPPTFRLPNHTRPLSQRAEFTIDPAAAGYQGTTLIDITSDAPRTRFWLHAKDMTFGVASMGTLEVDGSFRSQRPITITTIDAAQGLVQLDVAEPTDKLTVSIAFAAPYRDDLAGVFRTQVGADSYVFTDLEPSDARRMLPCFDEPRFKIPFTLTLVTPMTTTAVGNAAMATQQDGQQRTTRMRTTKPLPSYLWAFAVGPFDVVTGPVLPARADRPAIPVTGFAVRGEGKRMMPMLQWQAQSALVAEDKFGVAYPYDKLDAIAVPGFGGGGMENAGLITYRDSRVLLDDTSSPMMKRGTAELVAHEVAHQWFGDLVTLADWDDVWLNEGFATWFGGITAGVLLPEIDAMVRARERSQSALQADWWLSARQVRNPIRHAGDVENAFDAISYQKGASVLSMVQRSVDAERGDGSFLRGVGAYLSARSHGNATSAEFTALVGKHVQRDVGAEMASFLDQSGAPLLDVTLACDGQGNRLLINQQRALPGGVAEAGVAQRWRIPLCVAYGVGGDKNVTCTTITEALQVMPLSMPRCPTWVLPQADGIGHHRFSVGVRMLRQLVAARDQLLLPEQMALITSIQTDVMTGQLPLADAIALTMPFATAPHASLALAAAQLLWFTATELADDKHRLKIEQRIGQQWRGPFERLGFVGAADEKPMTTELRVSLLRMLLDVNEPVTTRKAAALGKAIASQPGAQPMAVAVDLIALVLGAHFTQASDDDWQAALTTAVGFSDGKQRQDWLTGLSVQRQVGRTPMVMAMGLDPRVRVNERLLGLAGQLHHPATRATAMATLPLQLDGWRKALPSQTYGRLPRMLAVGCDAGWADAIAPMFAADVAKQPALERTIRLGTEEVRACVLRKAMHQSLAHRVW